jgi:hypothetical protein
LALRRALHLRRGGGNGWLHQQPAVGESIRNLVEKPDAGESHGAIRRDAGSSRL